jgi:uncharacterized protein (DUF2252 family)
MCEFMGQEFLAFTGLGFEFTGGKDHLIAMSVSARVKALRRLVRFAICGNLHIGQIGVKKMFEGLAYRRV